MSTLLLHGFAYDDVLITHAVSSATCPTNSSTRCIGSARDYCPGSHTTGASCVEGYCRCHGSSKYDDCTCLRELISVMQWKWLLIYYVVTDIFGFWCTCTQLMSQVVLLRDLPVHMLGFQLPMVQHRLFMVVLAALLTVNMKYM